jgi:hypothetical protein
VLLPVLHTPTTDMPCAAAAAAAVAVPRLQGHSCISGLCAGNAAGCLCCGQLCGAWCVGHDHGNVCILDSKQAAATAAGMEWIAVVSTCAAVTSEGNCIYQELCSLPAVLLMHALSQCNNCHIS